jgi:hypothetical protein
MTRLRRIAIAALAAVTVTVGSLGPAPTASAAPRSCDELVRLVIAYQTAGWTYYVAGLHQWAFYWWGKAEVLAGSECVG